MELHTIQQIDNSLLEVKEKINELQEILKKQITITRNDNLKEYFKKVENHIQLSSLFINKILLLTAKNDLVRENEYIAAKKNINIAVSFIGDLVGKRFFGFLERTNRKKQLYENFELLEMLDYFKIIGIQINRLFDLATQNSKIKIKIGLVELKGSYCFILLNTLDFKKMIKFMDIENEKYYKYSEGIELTKKILEDSADSYWRLYMEIGNVEKNTTGIKKALDMVKILKQFNILTNDKFNTNRTIKKISSWENYYQALIKKQL